MQIQGDVKKFTKSIDATYESQLKEITKMYETTLAQAKELSKANTSEMKKSFTVRLKRETDLLNKKESSSAICDARLSFDEKKQELFESILNDIVSDAKSADSADFKKAISEAVKELSATQAKAATLLVSKKTLVPSSFKGSVEVTKDFIGVKIIDGESVTDLTIQTLVDTKKDHLAVLLHDALF